MTISSIIQKVIIQHLFYWTENNQSHKSISHYWILTLLTEDFNFAACLISSRPFLVWWAAVSTLCSILSMTSPYRAILSYQLSWNLIVNIVIDINFLICDPNLPKPDTMMYFWKSRSSASSTINRETFVYENIYVLNSYVNKFWRVPDENT